MTKKVWYIYRHIRLDNNEPFYIGRGQRKDSNFYRERYRRAFAKESRTKYWKNIINFTDYEIEILFESSNFEFICTKEKEFIQLYGRKDLELGTLINFSDGGENNQGFKQTQETIDRVRSKLIGRKQSKEFCEGNSKRMMGNKYRVGKKPLQSNIDKLRLSKIRPIDLYNIKGEFISSFDSIIDCSKSILCNKNIIIQCLSQRQKQWKGYVFTDKDKPFKIVDYKRNINCKIKCKDIENNTFTIFTNATEAGKQLNITIKSIYHNLRKASKVVAKRYIFSYY